MEFALQYADIPENFVITQYDGVCSSMQWNENAVKNLSKKERKRLRKRQEVLEKITGIKMTGSIGKKTSEE